MINEQHSRGIFNKVPKQKVSHPVEEARLEATSRSLCNEAIDVVKNKKDFLFTHLIR